ncbi:INO80 complex subunit [Lachnellula suecica]|uniref:INO80 complex subunit n=1 Tax=Lachnellula suecica TaxID=602035 RepID=A0A8T9C1H4_9HELO|nr:INO80 complex subunit [Lachnellula suecica]
MADESPVGSPLSDLPSDDFEAEEEHEHLAEALMPPAKRQKLGDVSLRGTPGAHPVEGSISSDTEGEIPQSPKYGAPQAEDEIHEQVTVCAWDGCDAGNMENMDKLVEHIHNEHIETRQKKYTCEWGDCTRKSMAHASGYALKAHMRSHTREKPFYCALPECDRAFTRSDALAKHMRTVHETEALRPSDPVPKYMHPQHKQARLKLLIKKDQSQPETPSTPATNGNTTGSPQFNGWTSSYPPELGFTSEEEARGAEQLWRLLRRQIHWAQEETEELKQQSEVLEQLRRKEWAEKEVLLDQVISNELSYQERRAKVLAGAARIPSADEIRMAAAMSPTAMDAVLQSPAPLNGQPVEDRTEAAAVLASLSQV